MFKPKGPYCQSCGMPLSRDSKGGGTQADGTKSVEYCSHCYELGMFREPDLTLEQMTEKVTSKLKEMHIPSFLCSYFTKDIAKLKRWQQDNVG